MGREIKYRTWVLRDSDNDEEVVPYMEDMNGVESYFNPFEEYRKGNIVLMQYTGLKDKNGREIYEGDILTSPEYPYQDDGKYNYHGVIEWIEEEASFYMTKRLANSEKRGMSNGISQPIESIEEFEVIGNIYENPELIEV
ncbi:hypothetical protein BSK62_13230 [Paenibacillus odorifer]|uniref:YopX family protein n=1 Tax=Paenibacillus odorifer TaxID=189426 RepID=UPI00096FCD4C|nr:YopX family protein [Paenibacillus odorifer]OMD66024.1 hypothetical protein BSK62_13230 [Paenibacillus odorifer]